MTTVLRDLVSSDFEQVLAVSQSVWDDDYAPLSFHNWIDDSNWYVYGVFENGVLLGFIALQLIPETNHAWVKALRIRNDRQGTGLGTQLTKHTITKAKEFDVKKLWYATSSRNKASIKIAEKIGFHLVNNVGYFRLEKPLPAHQTPSPNFQPHDIDAEGIHEILSVYPELITTETIPIAWNFETKDLLGLKRLEEKATFKVVRNEQGLPKALRISYLRERNDSKAAINTFYVLDRSIFVDLIARTIAEHDESDIDTLVFFLGPNGTEWSKTLGIVPEEYFDRRFLLYEKTL